MIFICPHCGKLLEIENTEKPVVFYTESQDAALEVARELGYEFGQDGGENIESNN